MQSMTHEPIRHDWTSAQVQALFALPFMDLLLRAQAVHRVHHAANTVQMSTLLSIKTGACPEDCAYCPQSARYATAVEAQPLMQLAEVRAAARRAQDAGATRFCLGGAYRAPKARDLKVIADMIREVRALGLETCVTLGMLERRAGADAQGRRARLLQPQPRHLERVLRRRSSRTRSYQDRLDTLERGPRGGR